MPAEENAGLRIVYVAHSLRSDWNNGNAHFLRGLVRAMTALGHDIRVLERDTDWSIENLQTETRGQASLAGYEEEYSDLQVHTYPLEEVEERWRERLRDVDIVILHEWNSPAMAQRLLVLRKELGFRLLFHDTHHRASSSPEQMKVLGIDRFDGVLAFGNSLRKIYHERFSIERVWTLHEAADITVFHPIPAEEKETDIVWIGNWGEGERTSEIEEFLLRPAAALGDEARFTVYGVRYPQAGLDALATSHVCYGGYLPNLEAPAIYSSARVTVHIPRQEYRSAMIGIPTIRVFEALACGIPLVSAPWIDSENLFMPGDYLKVESGAEMVSTLRSLLRDPVKAQEQAQRGLETVLARHTCDHRARELTAICEELLS